MAPHLSPSYLLSTPGRDLAAPTPPTASELCGLGAPPPHPGPVPPRSSPIPPAPSAAAPPPRSPSPPRPCPGPPRPPARPGPGRREGGGASGRAGAGPRPAGWAGVGSRSCLPLARDPAGPAPSPHGAGLFSLPTFGRAEGLGRPQSCTGRRVEGDFGEPPSLAPGVRQQDRGHRHPRSLPPPCLLSPSRNPEPSVGVQGSGMAGDPQTSVAASAKWVWGVQFGDGGFLGMEGSASPGFKSRPCQATPPHTPVTLEIIAAPVCETGVKTLVNFLSCRGEPPGKWKNQISCCR